MRHEHVSCCSLLSNLGGQLATTCCCIQPRCGSTDSFETAAAPCQVQTRLSNPDCFGMRVGFVAFGTETPANTLPNLTDARLRNPHNRETNFSRKFADPAGSAGHPNARPGCLSRHGTSMQLATALESLESRLCLLLRPARLVFHQPDAHVHSSCNLSTSECDVHTRLTELRTACSICEQDRIAARSSCGRSNTPPRSHGWAAALGTH